MLNAAVGFQFPIPLFWNIAPIRLFQIFLSLALLSFFSMVGKIYFELQYRTQEVLF